MELERAEEIEREKARGGEGKGGETDGDDAGGEG